MARFFLESSVLNEEEIIEFLLKRYGNLEEIKKMDISFFISFYKQALKKDTEEKLYMQWCSMLPQFAKFIPFNEFYDKATGRNIDRRDKDVIIAEINRDIEKMKEMKNGT